MSEYNIAFVSGAVAPYRVHLHRRLAREIPGLRLHSIFTHEVSTFPWVLGDVEEINPVEFGRGEDCLATLSWSTLVREWRKAGRILRYIADRGIDIVVVGGYSDSGRLRLILGCRRRGIPVLLFGDSNIHGDQVGGLRHLAKQPMLRVLVRCCDAVLVCGSLGEEYFRRYGASSDRIVRFPYEPNYDVFQRSAVPEQPADLEAVDPPRRRRIVYSGRLMSRKRVDLLLKSFADIAAERLEWDIAVVGDGPLREYLQGLVPAALRSRVEWLGFVNEEDRLAEIYRNSDVLVLPSDEEPWGVVVTEAAAAGLALVTSDAVGAGADVIVDGVNGFRFRTGDRASLTAALRQVTQESAIDRYKAGSIQVFERWHREVDPIHGFRRAVELVSTGRAHY